MRLIISIVIALSCLSVSGQNMELFGGLNTNKFYDNSDNLDRFQSSYDKGSGYSFGIAIDSVKVDWMILKLTLKFDKYSGSISAKFSSSVGGSLVSAEIDKSLISLGVYPINFRILKRIDFNIELELSKLIFESYEGTSTSWGLRTPRVSSNLQEIYNEYSSPITLGLSARLAYNFHVNESITISPQYYFYFGLSNEFINFSRETKSIRNFVGIGIKKKI